MKRRIRLEIEVDITVPAGIAEDYKEEGVSEDDMFDIIVQGLDIDVTSSDKVLVDVACWVEQ